MSKRGSKRNKYHRRKRKSDVRKEKCEEENEGKNKTEMRK